MTKTHTLFVSERDQEEFLDTEVNGDTSQGRSNDRMKVDVPDRTKDGGELKEFMKLIDEHDVSELEYEGPEKKIRLRKKTNGSTTPQETNPRKNLKEVEESTEENPSSNSEMKEESTENKTNYTTETITSTLVGTFYRGDTPDSESFVEVGDQISEGSAVCCIESLSIMNEVTSEVSGKVTDILLEDGDMVEYGQPLVKVQINS